MKKIFLIVAIAFCATVSFSQKKNVTTAAVTYQGAQKVRAELANYTKELLEAKEYIDLAIAHQDTKADPKAWMYKGKIYMELGMAIAMSNAADFPGMNAESLMEEGFKALVHSKEIDTKESYTDQVNEYAQMYRGQMSAAGIEAYTAKNFEMAMGGLVSAAEFGNLIGIQDSNFYFFGGLAALEVKNYEVAAEAFAHCVDWKFNLGESVGYLATSMKENGKEAEAEAMLKKAVEENPNNIDVLIHATNFYIDKKDFPQAVSTIESAIKLDPSNKVLHYNAGVLYESMDKFDEAEAAYLKTLSIDPAYTDAKYSLGVFYFNRGADLNNEANDLEFGDPKYDVMIAQSKEIWAKNCLPYLEDAAKDAPDDVIILEALKTVYGKLSMTDKFMETKKRIAELQG
jgi:tetratricopeptide (TPR) repeat protein